MTKAAPRRRPPPRSRAMLLEPRSKRAAALQSPAMNCPRPLLCYVDVAPTLSVIRPAARGHPDPERRHLPLCDRKKKRDCKVHNNMGARTPGCARSRRIPVHALSIPARPHREPWQLGLNTGA